MEVNLHEETNTPIRIWRASFNLITVMIMGGYNPQGTGHLQLVRWSQRKDGFSTGPVSQQMGV